MKITSQQWIHWNENNIESKGGVSAVLTVADFSCKWIKGDTFTLQKPLPPTFTIGYAINNSNTMEEQTAIRSRLTPVRKNRIEIRQKIQDQWTPPQFFPISNIGEIPGKKSPTRVNLRPQQHSFLRSVAWVLDNHFRMETDKTWEFSRIEWLRQISEECEHMKMIVGNNNNNNITTIKLQQMILRTSLDWDVQCNQHLLSDLTETFPVVIHALIYWTRCQFLIRNSNTGKWHRWSINTDWSAPIIFLNWNDERFSPIVWMEGISEIEEESLCPLLYSWVLPWLRIWGIYRDDTNIELEQVDTEPQLQPQSPVAITEQVDTEPQLQPQSPVAITVQVNTEPQQPPTNTTPPLLPLRILCNGWKKHDWQKKAIELGICTSKQSGKTTNTLQKTICEIRCELEKTGIQFIG